MYMYRSFLIYWTCLIPFVTGFFQNHFWKIFLVSSAMFALPLVHKFIPVFPARLPWGYCTEQGGSCTDQLSPGCETGFLHGPKDHGGPATKACKNGVGLGSLGNTDLAPVACPVTDLAANFAQNINLPLFSTGAMLLGGSDWTVYVPARADSVSCYVQSVVWLGLGGLIQYKHEVLIKYCEYSAPDM